jgi:ABC-type transport system involved in multi-copper enzyme maturation permease subunit
MNFTAGQLIGFVEQYGANIIVDRLIPFFLFIVGFFPISVSLVIALESFVGEKERGSIEPLLNSPVKRLATVSWKINGCNGATIVIQLHRYGRLFAGIVSPGILYTSRTYL